MSRLFLLAGPLAALLCACQDDPGSGLRCAAAQGEPLDLLPWARLNASETRANGELLWPLEAEDAIATLRDDQEETGWKPPDEGQATVEIDLQPWLGRPVALDQLSASFEGAPATVQVRLLEGCGADPWLALRWDELSEPLELGGACAGCLELEFTLDGEMTLLQLALTSRDASIEPPQLDPSDLGPALGAHAGSGVVEGFYGIPWTWRERRHAVANLARAGMDLYIYAPKDDPLHRDEWRTPYDEAQLLEFSQLSDFARQAGVNFFLGISPFIDFEEDDDYDALLDKLRPFAEDGLGGLALLADDIEWETEVTVDGALGQEHAAVANRLLEDLRSLSPGMQLIFVPTVYRDESLQDWEGAADYLAALADLHVDIAYMWTGDSVFSSTMQAADLDELRGLVGRDPVIWDNYWANDASDRFRGQLLLGAYDGREADLADAVQGVTANPALQGALARWNAAALADWLQTPGPADAARARDTAAALEAAFHAGVAAHSERDAALVRLLMEVHEGYALDVPEWAALEQGIEALLAELDGDGAQLAEAVRVLLPLLAQAAALPGEVHHSGLDVELADELAFPLARLRDEGLAGLWALQALGTRLGGENGEEALTAAWQALERAEESRFMSVAGDVEDLVEAVEACDSQQAGFVPVLPTFLPPPCQVGVELRWQPFIGATQLQVFGLPGATAEGSEVVWEPGWAGRYRVVVAGEGEGWGFREEELVCGG